MITITALAITTIAAFAAIALFVEIAVIDAMDGQKEATILIGDRVTTPAMEQTAMKKTAMTTIAVRTKSHQDLGTARDGEKEVAIFIGDRVTTTAMATTSRMVFSLAKPQTQPLEGIVGGCV